LDSKRFLFRAALTLFLLFIICSQGYSLKRQPGRRDNPVQTLPGLTWSPAQGENIVPGLFELLDFGNPEHSVSPCRLYYPPGQAQSGDTYYFARRIEIPVKGPFLVVGFLIFVPPGNGGETAPFPEILLVPQSADSGPDLSRPLIVRENLRPDPGSSELVVDVSGEELVLTGPGTLYLVVRFPPGPDAEVMLDTDGDAGLFPGSSFISKDGAGFLAFEQAASLVRPDFYSLEELPRPGLANDQLAFGLVLYTEVQNVTAMPPRVQKIEVSEGGVLRVKLTLPTFYADGRPLESSVSRVSVAHYSVGSRADSSIGDFEPDTDGWIEIRGLQARSYLLRFAALIGGNKAGLPSGARLVLPLDPDEPDGSTGQAGALTWRDEPGMGWSEGWSSEAGIRSVTDFDFYRLDLASGDSLVADLPGLEASYSALDPLISLLDSSGTVLAHAEGVGASVSCKVPESGVYYLLINDRAILQAAAFPPDGSRIYRLRARKLRSRGDLDGNGYIDYRDAFLVFLLTREILDTLRFTPEQRLAADFDGDRTVVGDLDDFLLVLDAASYVPSRDPNRPDKGKTSVNETELAAFGDRIWSLEFADGSTVKLSLDRSPVLGRPGPEAEKLLSLVSMATETDILARGVVPPKGISLEQNAPNPFNPSTAISFHLSLPGWASLEIFDTRGRMVRSIFRGLCQSGTNRFIWDGTETKGGKLQSGVYFYRLETENGSITRKMILVK